MRNIKLSCEQTKKENIAKPFTIMTDRKMLPTEDGVFYWHICNFTEKLTKHKTLLAIQDAFAEIEYHIHPLRFKKTEDIEKAHIKIKFIKQGRPDKDFDRYGLKFDGEGGTLAWGVAVDGWMFLDDAENWSSLSSFGEINLKSVFIHEVGHCFSIGHSALRNAIMYPFYNPKIGELQPDDIKAYMHQYKGEMERVEEAYQRKNEIFEKEVNKKYDSSLIDFFLGKWIAKRKAKRNK